MATLGCKVVDLFKGGMVHVVGRIPDRGGIIKLWPDKDLIQMAESSGVCIAEQAI